MPRAEAGSIKAVSNSIKAKGLTKLRFYCQICSKACRDENGYKNHIESESHLRQIAAIGGGSNAAKTIDRFSDQFQKEFVALLSRRFGTRRVRANQVYQEYIQERHHLHMNATQWQSLSQFVKHLGREGIVRAEENEKGWWIEWVDNSPAALARQDALLKMNRAKVDEETRERKFLKEQIERAKAGGGGGEEAKDAEQKEQRPEIGRLELQRDGNAPIKIGIGLKAKVAEGEADRKPDAPSANHPVDNGSSSNAPAGTSTSSTSAAKPFKLGLISNPLKNGGGGASSRSNVFKSASTSGATVTAQTKGSGHARPALTAAERIMAEEEERKRKKQGMGPQPSAKRMRM
ncbi:hypothetical protein IE81DRAFT_326140 [Ceraceosorus guamensis]|uniref:C2H2-type domain-containing protein n=1 Tax=Ceraceosorus guamensis TaxID=1522189 RepID=A0A316VTS4_9BASI|nr:hypothetical protein IE81DRAFT_326140 [Ceraceosorus guamensis]PWN39843.1 hypothetical protein IE81DRAFT_326140 [Ceraceosorus guamensis]